MQAQLQSKPSSSSTTRLNVSYWWSARRVANRWSWLAG